MRDGGFRFHVHGDEGKPSHPQASDPLLIEDPVDVFNNVARNCFRSGVVHRAFFEAYEKFKAAAVRHHQHRHQSRPQTRSPGTLSPVQVNRKALTQSRSKSITSASDPGAESASTAPPAARPSLRKFTVRSKSPVPAETHESTSRNDRLPLPSPLTRDMAAVVDNVVLPTDGTSPTRSGNQVTGPSKSLSGKSTTKRPEEADSDEDGSEAVLSSLSSAPPAAASQQSIISEEGRRRISEARALFESKTPRDSPLATPREASLERQEDSRRFESPKGMRSSLSDTSSSPSNKSNNKLLFEILGIFGNTMSKE